MKQLALILFLAVAAFPSCGMGRIRVVTSPTAFAITNPSGIPDQVEDVVSGGKIITTINAAGPVTCTHTGTLPPGQTENAECQYGVGQIPTTPGTYIYIVTANDGVTSSAPRTFTTTIAAAASIPSPYSQTDIGAPAIPGTCASSGDASGPWTITGNDTTYGNADKLRFCYQPVSGNQYMKGRFTGCATTGAFGQRCTLMVRQALTAGSIYGMVGRGTTPKSLAQWRTVADDLTGDTEVATGSFEWFYLTFYNGQVSFFYSDTGVDGPWTQVGQTQNLALTGTYYIGLAVSSSSTSAVATATVTNVEVGTFTPPAGSDFNGYRGSYQGFGKDSVGGRGGVSCGVNSLADTSTVAVAGGANNPDYRGTLRGCMTAAAIGPGPVFVLFETSGTIQLTSNLRITKPYQTVAGQTAPSPGITIRATYGITQDTHDLVWQHVRIRMGWHAAIGSGVNAWWMHDGAFNIVADHLSISWGCKSNILGTSDAGGSPSDILIVDTIISEGLNSPWTCGSSNMVDRSQAVVFGYTESGTLTMTRNLIAHNILRNPRFDAGFRTIGVNNVSYNGAENGTVFDTVQTFFFVCGTGSGGGACNGFNTPYETVLLGNIGIPGPSTPLNRPWLRIQGGTAGSTVYLADNVGTGVTSASASCSGSPSQWTAGIEVVNKWVPTGEDLVKANICQDTFPSWYTVFNITPLSTSGDNATPGGTSTARAYVLAHVGARPYDRDTIDAAVVASVSAGTGTSGPITEAASIGGNGFPTLAVNTRTTTGQIPSNPNSIAAGQTFRTNIEIWLESNSTFGATRSGVEAP